MNFRILLVVGIIMCLVVSSAAAQANPAAPWPNEDLADKVVDMAKDVEIYKISQDGVIGLIVKLPARTADGDFKNLSGLCFGVLHDSASNNYYIQVFQNNNYLVNAAVTPAMIGSLIDFAKAGLQFKLDAEKMIREQ